MYSHMSLICRLFLIFSICVRFIHPCTTPPTAPYADFPACGVANFPGGPAGACAACYITPQLGASELKRCLEGVGKYSEATFIMIYGGVYSTNERNFFSATRGGGWNGAKIMPKMIMLLGDITLNLLAAESVVRFNDAFITLSPYQYCDPGTLTIISDYPADTFVKIPAIGVVLENVDFRTGGGARKVEIKREFYNKEPCPGCPDGYNMESSSYLEVAAVVFEKVQFRNMFLEISGATEVIMKRCYVSDDSLQNPALVVHDLGSVEEGLIRLHSNYFRGKSLLIGVGNSEPRIVEFYNNVVEVDEGVKFSDLLYCKFEIFYNLFVFSAQYPQANLLLSGIGFFSTQDPDKRRAVEIGETVDLRSTCLSYVDIYYNAFHQDYVLDDYPILLRFENAIGEASMEHGYINVIRSTNVDDPLKIVGDGSWGLVESSIFVEDSSFNIERNGIGLPEGTNLVSKGPSYLKRDSGGACYDSGSGVTIYALCVYCFNECQNDGVVNDDDCSCSCSNFCAIGDFRSSDCSCETCPEGCSECNIEKCFECADDYYSHQGRCVRSCQTEVFPLMHWYDGPSRCRSCSSAFLGCNLCIDGTSCIECDENLYLHGTTQCVRDCSSLVPKNSYVRVVDPPICVACGDYFDNCETCDPNECIQCLENFKFFEGNCFANCGEIPSAPLNTYYAIPSMDCEPCNTIDPRCIRCDESGMCSECSLGYYAYDGGCVLDCAAIDPPNSHIPWESLDGVLTCEVCSSINPGCTECQDNECVSCDGDSFLFGGECVSNCGEHNVFVVSTNPNVCGKCLPNCVSCPDDENHCSQCKPDYFLFENVYLNHRCTKHCGSFGAYYNDGTVCSDCFEHCEGRCNEEDGSCFACKSGWRGNNECTKSSCDALDECNHRNGKCIGSNLCECNEGWRGNLDCSHPSCNGKNECLNGGICKGPNVCDCSSASGFSGDRCEIADIQASRSVDSVGGLVGGVAGGISALIIIIALFVGIIVCLVLGKTMLKKVHHIVDVVSHHEHHHDEPADDIEEEMSSEDTYVVKEKELSEVPQ